MAKPSSIPSQLGRYPAVSVLKVLEKKDINETDDETLILADIADKALRQVKEVVKELLLKNHPEEKAEEMAEILTTGKWTHDYPLTCKQLSEMGFTVSNEMLREMYLLMELYPQPPQRRPSVQYVPYNDGAGKR